MDNNEIGHPGGVRWADTHQDKYNEQSSISLVILDESDATYILVNSCVQPGQ